MKRQIKSFTEGGIFFKVLLFVLPIVATNLLQVFYNAADMIIVSFSHEENAVGAIGTTAAFINLIVNLFIGFSVGANVVVAREIGARNPERIQKAVHTALLMAVIFGLAGMGIGLVCAKPVLELMGNTGSLLKLAVRYTRIYFLGVPFLALTNYLMAIFRAKGDAATPLVVLMAAGLLNVGLNFLFVLVIGLSVEGVAIATSVSNLASSAALLLKLRHDKDDTRFCRKMLKLDKRAFHDITVNGIPAGIQGALFSLSNMIIQSSVVQMNNILCPGSSYAAVVDGNAAAGNLEGFIYTAMNAVYQGAITFTSQNLGARKPRRIYRILGVCLGIVAVIGAGFSTLFYLLRQPLLGLYGIAADTDGTLAQLAFHTAVTRLKYICVPYFLCGMMDVCSGVLRGMGRSITSMMISLLGACVFRLVWIYTVFQALQTLDSIYISYPISWLLTLSASLSTVLICLRRICRRMN